MDVVIIGAGGHGKVVLDVLRAAALHKPIGFLDADPSLIGTEISGLGVLGAINILPKLRQRKVRGAIVAIGDNRTRLRYADLLREQGFELLSAVHPSASVSPSATLGANVVIAPQAALCTEARVGDCVIVNTAAVVDHECVIEQGVHVAPGVHLAGRVRVGACAFIGMGANVLQCLSIGAHATLGAGAVALRDVPPYATAVGVPAKVIKVAAQETESTGPAVQS